jgi:methylmalonyl-CoA epimerase
MKILGMHHVAIAVDDLQKYKDIFENIFDIETGAIEENEKNKVALSFLDLGNTELEFVSPLDDNSPIAKFVNEKGSGIHHICVLVDDVKSAIDELKTKDIRMIDQTPRLTRRQDRAPGVR